MKPSRFRVAVLDAPEEDAGPWGRPARPCAIDGQTFICAGRAPLLADAEGVHAEATLTLAGAGREIEGKPEKLTGHWPNAAWLLTEIPGRYRDDRDHSFAYRWRTDHWEPFADWVGIPRRTVPWGAGLLVDGVAPSRVGADQDVLSYVVGGTLAPLPALRLSLRTSDPPRALQDLRAVDGTVFLLASAPKTAHLMVERLTPGVTPDRLDDLSPRETEARLWVKSARDVVAFGGPVDVDEDPLLRHFDGDAWTKLEPPPGVDLVVGYARGDDGTERVFAFRGDVLSLWERARGAAWVGVDLPALAPGESITGHWVTNDDAWLRLRVGADPGRLLRLRPVTHVAELTADGVRLVPARVDDVLPAAIPRVLPADPSPFHVAVIGYDGPVNGRLPNPLRLCASGGRTRVCGFEPALAVAREGDLRPDPEGSAGKATDVAASPAPKAWTSADLPPGVTHVEAYQRATTGVERVVAHVGEALAIFERPLDPATNLPGPWHPLRLPSLGPRDELHRAWLVNDDAWLLVWPADLERDPPRLLRLAPVKKVWAYPRHHPGDPGW